MSPPAKKQRMGMKNNPRIFIPRNIPNITIFNPIYRVFPISNGSKVKECAPRSLSVAQTASPEVPIDDKKSEWQQMRESVKTKEWDEHLRSLNRLSGDTQKKKTTQKKKITQKKKTTQKRNVEKKPLVLDEAAHMIENALRSPKKSSHVKEIRKVGTPEIDKIINDVVKERDKEYSAENATEGEPSVPISVSIFNTADVTLDILDISTDIPDLSKLIGITSLPIIDDPFDDPTFKLLEFLEPTDATIVAVLPDTPPSVTNITPKSDEYYSVYTPPYPITPGRHMTPQESSHSYNCNPDESEGIDLALRDTTHLNSNVQSSPSNKSSSDSSSTDSPSIDTSSSDSSDEEEKENISPKDGENPNENDAVQPPEETAEEKCEDVDSLRKKAIISEMEKKRLRIVQDMKKDTEYEFEKERLKQVRREEKVLGREKEKIEQKKEVEDKYKREGEKKKEQERKFQKTKERKPKKNGNLVIKSEKTGNKAQLTISTFKGYTIPKKVQQGPERYEGHQSVIPNYSDDESSLHQAYEHDPAFRPRDFPRNGSNAKVIYMRKNPRYASYPRNSTFQLSLCDTVHIFEMSPAEEEQH